MKKIFILTLLISILIPTTIMAADEYTLLEPLPCIEGTGNNCTGSTTTATMNLETYIGYIFKFAIAVSAFLAVIMIIYGGFEIMLSEAVSTKLDGKGRIQNAIYGLLMVLASYLILRTIDPRLVEINTRIEPLRIASSTEMVDYYNQLSTTNSMVDNAALQKKMDTLDIARKQRAATGELNDINMSLENDGDILSAEEISALEVKKVAAEQKIKDLEIQRGMVTAESIGIGAISQVNAIAYGGLTANKDELTPYTADPSTGTNLIKSGYDAQIEKVKALDPHKAQMLERQRNFIIAEARDAAALSKILEKKNDASKVNALNSSLEFYKLQVSNPQEIQSFVAGIGLSEADYKNIIQTKINLISSALKK